MLCKDEGHVFGSAEVDKFSGNAYKRAKVQL